MRFSILLLNQILPLFALVIKQERLNDKQFHLLQTILH